MRNKWKVQRFLFTLTLPAGSDFVRAEEVRDALAMRFGENISVENWVAIQRALRLRLEGKGQ